MKKRNASYTNFSVMVFSIGLIIGLLMTMVFMDKVSITGLSVGTMSSTCDFGDDYSGSGDWNINQDTYCRDMIIILQQNHSLQVNSKLVLQNITLLFNSSDNLTIGLYVNPGGSLYINSTRGDPTTVNSTSANRYQFQVNGYIDLHDAVIDKLGNNYLANLIYRGIYLNYSGGGLIDNITVLDCYTGIAGSDAARGYTIANSNFTSLIDYLAVDYYGNDTLFRHNYFSTVSVESGGSGYNNIFESNFFNGSVMNFGANTTVRDNTFFNGASVAALAGTHIFNNTFSGIRSGSLVSCSNCYIYSNNITIIESAVSQYGIQVGNDSTVNNNSIRCTAPGANNYGMVLGASFSEQQYNISASGNNISNCYINGGLLAQNITLIGNNLSSGSIGLYYYDNPGFVSAGSVAVIGGSIRDNSVYNIYMVSPVPALEADTIQDIVLTGAGTADLYLDNGGNLTLINVSYGSISVNGDSVADIKWYLDIRANTSSNGNLEGVNVQVYGSSDDLVSSLTTDSSGRARAIIKDMTISISGTTGYNNHTMIPSISGYWYPPLTKILNISNNTVLNLPMLKKINSNSQSTSEWKMYGRTLDNNRYYPASVNAAYMRQIWNFSTGGIVYSVPAVADGIVYFGSYDNRFYALNASDGVHIWNYTTSDDIYSSPALAGGMVFFGGWDRHFYCLNATTGMHIWNYTVGTDLLSSPSVADGLVIFDGNRTTFALDAFNGQQVWNYSSASNMNNLIITIADNRVYIAGESFFNPATALNLSNGAVVWRNYYYNNTRRFSAYVGNIIYYPFAGDGATLLALDARNGSFVWQSPLTDQQMGGLSISNGRIFVGSLIGSYAKFLWSFDTVSGATLWNFYDLGRHSEVWGAPLSTDDAVFFGGYVSADPSTGYYALSVSDGSLLWYYNSSTHDGTTGSPSMADGVLFSGNRDGKVYAFKSFPPPSSSSASTIGGGPRSISYTPKPAIQCKETWRCSSWSVCTSDGSQTRVCTPTDTCGSRYDNMPKNITIPKKPDEVQNCVYTPTCYDSIKNQGETGLDCGGSCSACITAIESPMNMPAATGVSQEEPSTPKSSLWLYLIIAAALILVIILLSLLIRKNPSVDKHKWKLKTRL